MKIALDTNILIYASLNNSFVRNEINYICLYHTLVLSQYVINEYLDVITRKKINKYKPINILNYINYSVVESNDYGSYNMFSIRDSNDYQVLYDAIIEDVDILITNDKDFDDVKINKPKIMTSKQFFIEFMQEVV